MTETKSWLFKGGDGSWKYLEMNNQTEWSQVNTLIFRNPLLFWLFSKLVYAALKKLTSRSMRKAKKLIESNEVKNG